MANIFRPGKGRGNRMSTINDQKKQRDRVARSLGMPTDSPHPNAAPKTFKHPRIEYSKRVAQAQRSNARWAQDRIPKQGSGYGLAPARPAQKKAGGFEVPTSRGSYSRLTIFGTFSGGQEEMRVVRGVSEDLLERWWFIERNELPRPDYDSWIPTSDDDLRAEHKDEDAALIQRAREQIDELRGERTAAGNALLARISEIDDEILRSNSSEEIAELKTEIRKLQNQKRQVDDEYELEVERIKATYHEARDESWQELIRRQNTEAQRANDKVEDLKTNLINEVQQAADTWFGASDLFTVERWILE